jgi:hypothetical protein
MTNRGLPFRARNESDVESLDLEAISRRLAAVTAGPWVLVESGSERYILLGAQTEPRPLYVRRELEQAGREDVAFIAHMPEDVGFLLSVLESGTVSESDVPRISEIEVRVEAATPGPWWDWLESSGALGGSSMISVLSDEFAPDIYLWHGDRIASDSDIEFVAHGRQDVPLLLAAVRSLLRTSA